MKTERTVRVQDQHLHYTLEEKPIKNVNLRIRPDGSVYVSAPLGTSRTLIDDFVASKSKQILVIQQAQSAMAPTPRTYADGEVIQLLGRSVTLRAVQGTRDEAVWQDDTLLLRLRHPADSAARKRLTESFIGSQCQSVFSAAVDAAYPPFAHLGAAKPCATHSRYEKPLGLLHAAKGRYHPQSQADPGPASMHPHGRNA